MDNYQASLNVVNRLVRKTLYDNATKVAIYKNEGDEINTSFILYNHLISENKEVVWIESEEFDASGCDLVIIPVITFDDEGKYVSRINVHNYKKIVGFALEEQRSDFVDGTRKAIILTEKVGYNV